MEERRLSLATGAEVQAALWGAGASARPKCLLLHGNPGSLVDWQRVAAGLAATAEVVAIDLPGFGRSPRTGAEQATMTLDRLAEHVVAAADALSWREPFFVVGHSHGGGVAQTLAVQHAPRIAGIALVASLGAPAHASYRLLSLPGAATVAGAAGRLFGSHALRPLSRGLMRLVLKDIFAPERAPAAKVAAELEAFAARPELLLSMVQVARGRPCDQLAARAPQIRCPVLFVHGASDALVPPACARAIHERIVAAGGRSQFRELPGAGHMLIDFQAAEVVDSLARFVTS
jgi:pimeloyl-ACP methyl ester carboxylesterase